MTELRDDASRRRALTDLEATLLVEAAAGTGKTSLLAGRVLVLFAGGVPPRDIAAITFTEFAAGELRERVSRYLDEVLAGRVPRELRLAFKNGVTEAQEQGLWQARSRMDEVTCTTIHGFCHDLLRTYAVEAAIDPGADILDAVQADLAFASIFDQWLRRRLNNVTSPADPIVLAAQFDPIGAYDLLRYLARFRREHRTARAPNVNVDLEADVPFVSAVVEFRQWFADVGGPAEASADIAELEQLAAHFEGKFDPAPDLARLWALAHPPRLTIMRRQSFDLQRYQRRGVWSRAARGVEGQRLADEATRHYDACADTFRALMGELAAAAISTFTAELDELLDTFEKFKRRAAVLDFDDLLYMTRDMLRVNHGVRAAAAKRFQRILVDEFQDTDPIQAEIVFLLAGIGAGSIPWHERRLLPGRLFMVGDPRQAIYRFRGADIATYRRAREAVERDFPGNVLHVTSNFRSCEEIVKHINRCFEAPLQAQGTGYVALEPTRGEATHGLPGVAKVRIDTVARVADMREEEARVVAETCARLIGNLEIGQKEQKPRLLAPGDIALLAPTGTELWRYERALEEAGLPFSSQAGKNFFRRQETQDLVALVRTLAASRDTLALGAVLRGPLVGLTEQELLDIAANLPPSPDRPNDVPRLSLRTDPASVQHPVARHVLGVLRELRRRVRSTAPALVMAEAVERLRVRTVLAARSHDQASRALANVDALIERARAYSVRGFRQFALDLDADWSRCVSHAEGVVDAEGQSIEIVTIHSSKGLEWPVIIPINTASRPRRQDRFVHRREDDTLHWMLSDIVPPSLVSAMHSEEEEESQQRLRLLHVACTRAMDMLILPELPWMDDGAWARAVDYRLAEIPALDIAHFEKKPVPRASDPSNSQTPEIFSAEQRRITQSFQPIFWVRPSEGDPDIVQFEATAGIGWDQPIDATARAAGSSTRGIILHKLMEELLTGALEAAGLPLQQRAAALIEQFHAGPKPEPEPALDAKEMAATALRTISLPELATGRAEILPEVPIYGRIGADGQRLVTGRADAVRFRDGRAHIVFDWKSDVAPAAATTAAHGNQLALYVRVLDAERGALVYMTSGRIQWVEPRLTDLGLLPAADI
jgi:CRISPR-associated exonuclease Cas4